MTELVGVLLQMKVRSRTVRGYKTRSGLLAGLIAAGAWVAVGSSMTGAEVNVGAVQAARIMSAAVTGNGIRNSLLNMVSPSLSGWNISSSFPAERAPLL